MTCDDAARAKLCVDCSPLLRGAKRPPRRTPPIWRGRATMATRAPFLTTRFGGYYHRDVPQEDTELTHVGPGTPCGEYLRRFWQPIALPTTCATCPLRVTILGEDLVVFRDFRGAWGCWSCTVPTAGPLWSLA